MDISEIWPPYALTLTSGEMELSPVTDSDIPELSSIARGGVRRDDLQAFQYNWDTGDDEQIARSLAQYHWSTRAEFTPDKWTVEFTVRVGGRAVGIQGVNTNRYQLTRTVSTGSWLALDEQGHGFGTRMRGTVIDAFIRHFDAERFETGFFEGNDASRRVSEKLGYSPNGSRRIIAGDGVARTEHKMVLQAEDFQAPAEEVSVAGAEVFRRFIGLDQ